LYSKRWDTEFFLIEIAQNTAATEGIRETTALIKNSYEFL